MSLSGDRGQFMAYVPWSQGIGDFISPNLSTGRWRVEYGSASLLLLNGRRSWR
jgi:hypothetical protein